MKPLRKLLIVSKTAPGQTDPFAELAGREDFHLVRVAILAHAESALHDPALAIAIAGADVAAAQVEELLALLSRGKRRIPLLAIRDRGSDERPGWLELGIGVLRPPLLPGALGRSIEVVLGLRRSGV